VDRAEAVARQRVKRQAVKVARQRQVERARVAFAAMQVDPDALMASLDAAAADLLASVTPD